MSSQMLNPAMKPVDGSIGQRSASIDLETTGRHVIRYGLALVVAWIGLMKFTAYEAGAIEGLVANSPFMAWMYSLLGVRQVANLIGVSEVGIAVLIALRPVSARASSVGSALAAGMFLMTLSFMATTPGVGEASLGGFPALSVVPGQFLVKDVVLLGAALWSFGEARRAATPQ